MSPGAVPEASPQTNTALIDWMGKHSWVVGPARFEKEAEAGFHVWQEHRPGRVSHALWISESMVRRLSAEQLVRVLDQEEMDQEIRISLRVRIEERGTEYRISVVPRRSGEWPKLE